MHNLIVATRNRHKLDEVQTILGHGFQVAGLDKFPGAPEIIEDAPDFAGNAAKKALGLAQWLAAGQPAGLPADWAVLADDSGLEVDALDGAPGVISARFASTDAALWAANSPDAANNAKLLQLLAGLPWEKRTARFRCVLAWVEGRRPEGPPEIFEGVCEGRIQFGPTGQGGFGYDPLFVPTGWQQSFAELGAAVKNRLSHRARALEQFRAWLEAGRPPRLGPPGRSGKEKSCN